MIRLEKVTRTVTSGAEQLTILDGVDLARRKSRVSRSDPQGTVELVSKPLRREEAHDLRRGRRKALHFTAILQTVASLSRSMRTGPDADRQRSCQHGGPAHAAAICAAAREHACDPRGRGHRRVRDVSRARLHYAPVRAHRGDPTPTARSNRPSSSTSRSTPSLPSGMPQAGGRAVAIYGTARSAKRTPPCHTPPTRVLVFLFLQSIAAR